MDSINRPLKILSTLDQLLSKPLELIIIGRSALALGYKKPQAQFFSTMDVDAIISDSYVSEIESNFDFWEASEKLNIALENEGLYFTHIFEEKQIIIRPNWYNQKQRLLIEHFEKIQLYRPHTIDLILSKMMRNDPEDFDDIRFLLDQLEGNDLKELPNQIQSARLPDLEEIQELFNLSKDRLLKLLKSRN